MPWLAQSDAQIAPRGTAIEGLGDADFSAGQSVIFGLKEEMQRGRAGSTQGARDASGSEEKGSATKFEGSSVTEAQVSTGLAIGQAEALMEDGPRGVRASIGVKLSGEGP